MTCKAEVEAQKDPHFCQTCQVSQCKTCIAKHWPQVDGTCALQVKMQKHQYKKVACEIAAEGIDHRRQNRAESASTANTHDQLKEYSKRIRAGGLACYVVCHKQPLCKRSFQHSYRKRWAGDMQNCSVCHAYCHKGCGMKKTLGTATPTSRAQSVQRLSLRCNHLGGDQLHVTRA